MPIRTVNTDDAAAIIRFFLDEYLVRFPQKSTRQEAATIARGLTDPHYLALLADQVARAVDFQKQAETWEKANRAAERWLHDHGQASPGPPALGRILQRALELDPDPEECDHEGPDDVPAGP